MIIKKMILIGQRSGDLKTDKISHNALNILELRLDLFWEEPIVFIVFFFFLEGVK